jgi:hypothetical protein
VDATLPLLGAPPKQGASKPVEQPYGYMDPAAWERFALWMRDNELIAGSPSAESLLTNSLLPGRVPE